MWDVCRISCVAHKQFEQSSMGRWRMQSTSLLNLIKSATPNPNLRFFSNQPRPSVQQANYSAFGSCATVTAYVFLKLNWSVLGVHVTVRSPRKWSKTMQGWHWSKAAAIAKVVRRISKRPRFTETSSCKQWNDKAVWFSPLSKFIYLY